MTLEERLEALEKRIKDLETWNFHGQENPNITKWDKEIKKEK